MRVNIAFAVGMCIALTGLLACAGPRMPNTSDGRAFFNENCVSCHGTTGRGDGPSSKDFPVTPANLTLLSRANGGTFPTVKALAYIYGDPVQGHLARVMPQFGQLMSDDLVPVEIDGVFTPTPRALAALLVYLESIQD